MTESPCILAIDTATGPCSVAVWKDGAVAAYVESTGAAMQSARLLPLIDKAFHQAKITYRDLTSVACTIGPGSFTGIRVGMATARGIAFAADIPSMGFTTLDVMAFEAANLAKGEQQMLALLNAGKGEWYYQGFRLTDAWSALYSPRVGALEDALHAMKAPVLVAGNADQLPEGFHVTPVTFPRADALATLAAMTDVASAQPLKPFYIRPPDAKPMTVDS